MFVLIWYPLVELEVGKLHSMTSSNSSHCSSTFQQHFSFEMMPVLHVCILTFFTALLDGIQSANTSVEPSSLPSSLVLISVSTFPPSIVPSPSPSFLPSTPLTLEPTQLVSLTLSPSFAPSFNSTAQPTAIPSATFNTSPPSASPTSHPTVPPTVEPTSVSPTALPTLAPTPIPTLNPTQSPSAIPTAVPTLLPTVSLAPTVSSLCRVDHGDWINNGLCDAAGNYNTAVCDYDGGDCCQSTRSVASNRSSSSDLTGSKSFVFCTDPLIHRNASVSFLLGNVSRTALRQNETEIINDLIILSLEFDLQLRNSLASIIVKLNQPVNNLIMATVFVSYEKPLVQDSSVVANLSSSDLGLTLSKLIQSGEYQNTLRQQAVLSEVPQFQWSIICTSVEVCEAALLPTLVASPDSACSYGNWRNFYGWSDSNWSGTNFPKYFLWLLFQFFLVMWFTLCISLCYYQERFFLSRSRRLQFFLSIITSVLIMIYLLLEIFVPGLYSEPKTFSCIEFSFHDNAEGLKYYKASPDDFFYWNPYSVTVLLTLNAIVCLSVNFRVRNFERRVMDVCPTGTLCRGWLLLFHYITRLEVALTMLLLPLPTIQLLLYAINPNIGVYTAIPLSSLAVPWQVVCGVQILVSVAYAQLQVAVFELHLRLRNGQQHAGDQNESTNKNCGDLSTAPCVDMSEEESIRGGANSDSSGGNNADKREESKEGLQVSTVSQFKDPETVVTKLVKVVLGVLWIVTAVVDLKDKPRVALVLYSVVLRICLFAVVFQLSYSTDTQLPR